MTLLVDGRSLDARPSFFFLLLTMFSNDNRSSNNNNKNNERFENMVEGRLYRLPYYATVCWKGVSFEKGSICFSTRMS